MDFKIEIALDQEDGLDIEDVLGTIRISDYSGSIVEEDTYLDSWLYALIINLPGIERREIDTVDLVDEPNPLEFLYIDNGLLMRYKDKTINIENKDVLRQAIGQAAQDLLSHFGKSAETSKNEMLSVISKFARSN